MYIREKTWQKTKALHLIPFSLVNYIQWNVVKQLINELNEEMRDIAFKLTEPDMHHIIEPTPR